MTSTSTTQKGIDFEKKVYEILLTLIINGGFILPYKQTKVFQRKGYYSSKREKEIIFDISMETSIENAENYSLLTLVECKDLQRPVSVDDIEEFSKKINQVGEHNTKAIFITTNSFQTSAYKLAKAERITLIRISSDDKLDWINYRKKRTFESLDPFELEQYFTSKNTCKEAFITDYSPGHFTNFADLLISLKVIDYFNDSIEFIKIPYIKTERIKYITEKLFKYDIFEGYKINIEKLVSLISDKYKMTFEFDTIEQNNILGKIEFNPLKISIANKARVNRNHWRYTVAHEIGHLILHSAFLKERIENNIDDEVTLSLNKSISNKTTDRLEFQANLFASHLLLPEKKLLAKMNSIFNEYNIHRAQLYLDFQPVNQREVYTILNHLSEVFHVSVEAIKFRLIRLNLLVDKTDISLKTILRNKY